jgi:glycosyltransferase involved in cell wall biosynthesis
MSPALPKVSVIIPTHNRAHVIQRALHSVLHQTYENLEVIVVDDASTDNTAEIIHSLDDKRIIFLRQETCQGAAAARNAGIHHATGEYIAFQDSDDEWLNQKLEKQMAVMLHSSDAVGVVYSGFLRFEDKSAKYFPSKQVKPKSGSILRPLLSGNFVTTQAVVIRKECLLKSGLFDEQLPRLQDWELFLRLAKFYEFVCVDEPLLIAFHSRQSITADSSLFQTALKILLEKHENKFRAYPKVLAKHYVMLSLLMFRTWNFKNGIKYLCKSLHSFFMKALPG